jgi:CRISPR-associated protein Cas2
MAVTEKTYLIMYDIRHAKRLRRIHAICKEYGLPQQYSVFEARLTQRRFLTFCRKVSAIIAPGEDQLVCMPICEACRKQMTTMGQGWNLSHEESCIII